MACGENGNPCKKCNQGITTPKCTNICDFEVSSDCVKVPALECIGNAEGENLTAVLESLCGGGGGGENCPCPVSTYTVNSVCQDRDTSYMVINITPNFTINTPVLITTSFYSDQVNPIITGAISGAGTTVDSISTGVPINIFASIFFNSAYLTTTEGETVSVSFRVTDDFGNYSEVFTILESEIPTC
jgi:hypothetical protein